MILGDHNGHSRRGNMLCSLTFQTQNLTFPM
jgi:hypothetical protein